LILRRIKLQFLKILSFYVGKRQPQLFRPVIIHS
jgi:hypothetical protein